MSNMQRIKDMDLGVEIELWYSTIDFYDYTSDCERPFDKKITAHLIAGQGDHSFIIGWKTKETNIGHWRMSKDLWHGYETVPDIEEYKYGWMIGYNQKFNVVSVALNLPDQICSGCGLPAPHVHPNDNDKFTCVSCKFLRAIQCV